MAVAGYQGAVDAFYTNSSQNTSAHATAIEQPGSVAPAS